MHLVTRAIPYAVGSVFTYVFAFGAMFIGGSSRMDMRMVWAVAMSIPLWFMFVPIQLLLQWLFALLIGKRAGHSIGKRVVILNLPVAAIVIVLLSLHIYDSTPRKLFEEMLVKPAPQSVQSIIQGKFRTMDTVYVMVSFTIAPRDLERLLSDLHFEHVSEEEMATWGTEEKRRGVSIKRYYLDTWERSILSYTALKVHFPDDWDVYKLTYKPREGGTRYEKYILFSPDKTQAVCIDHST